MTSTTFLIGILAAAISGLSGYFISFRFNRSDYAGKDTSGDFGTPRGGYFSILSGSLIGMWLFSLTIQLVPSFPKEAVGVAMLTSMIVGFVGGIAGMIHGIKSRQNRQKKD